MPTQVNTQSNGAQLRRFCDWLSLNSRLVGLPDKWFWVHFDLSGLRVASGPWYATLECGRYCGSAGSLGGCGGLLMNERRYLESVTELASGSTTFIIKTWPEEWKVPPVAVFASFMGLSGRK